MNTAEIKQRVNSIDFKTLYCQDGDTERYIKRFYSLLDGFSDTFGDSGDIRLFSAPGRTEIGGNHTDHQHGAVVAGSLNLDVIGAVRLNGENIIRIKSEGFPMDTVSLDNLQADADEYGKSSSLIRGIATCFLKKGYKELAVFSSGRKFIASNQRTEAFLSACEEMGITVKPESVYQDDSTAEGGYRMAQHFCADGGKAKAVFCDYDAIAFGALKAFREKGISVPEDLELLSIDITSLELASHSSPALSVIKMPNEKMGFAAMDLIKEKLAAHNMDPTHIETEPELILRESFILP